ncbi:MAG: hypothetical protein ACOX2O_04060 [Bdellovibrionota bacterium]|jgi:hypothetical protein
MVSNHYQKGQSVIATMLVLLTLALVGVAAIVGLQLFSDLYRRSAYAALEKSLKSRDLTTVKNALNTVATEPQIFRFFLRESSYDTLKQASSYSEDEGILSELFELYTLTSPHTSPTYTTLKRFKNLPESDSLKTLLQERTPPPNALSPLSTLTKKLSTTIIPISEAPAAVELDVFESVFSRYLHVMRQLQRKASETPLQINANKTHLSQLKTFLLDLRTDFADFLSLSQSRTARKKNTAKSQELSFYTSGIFKDLPQLPTLPDNIETAKDLSNLLQKLGGEVALYGKDAPQIFEDKISTFRKAAVIYREKIQNLQEENKRLEAELETITKEAELSAKEVHYLIKKTLLYVTRV